MIDCPIDRCGQG